MEGLERYRKIKDLGEGAQGNVILAWDTLLERNVAIKSLHMSLTSDTLHVKRFKEEAKTLASLGHPSIVGVYEYIANSSGCHLMMEYFEGHPLDLYIRNVTGPIPEERTIDIFIKVLEAMSHIHKKKIIHRDIKPSNIMINDKSEIRLLDFGIAKNTENDPTLTKIGGSAGYTPMYMSPEHCNGEPITKYSDIYSLGITLWQMLTGKAPYEGSTQGQIYSKVANEPLPTIQSVYENVSLKMNDIVQKATHKSPKERYKSCDDFKKELLQLKNHINRPETEFIYNLSVKIVNEIKATIYINEDQHYGTKFTKAYPEFNNESNNSPIEIIVEKPGYKKFKKQLFLKKDEKVNIKLEKQTFLLASVVLDLKNKAVPYLNNIKPNLINLYVFFKLSSVWAKESIISKFNKNRPAIVEIIERKKIKTRKEINKKVEGIKPHKKEYAVYLVLLSVFIFSVFSVFSGTEEQTGIGNSVGTNSLDFPIVNFKTLKTEIPESQNSAKIQVLISEPSKSIVKVLLKYTGTASNKTDYNKKSDTLIIQANQKLGFIELDIINDKTKEQDETILIELINPINATLGEKSNYSYTILNDDIEKIPIKRPKKRRKKRTKKTHPTKGEKYYEKCNGFDLYQYYHDGKGGSYRKLVRENSTTCGFKKKSTVSNYNEIIRKENHDRRTKPNKDGYFITINDSGKKNSYVKVWKVGSKFMINEYAIIGRIKNIYYSNHKFYSNKGEELLDHHIIDVKNTNRSYLGTKKIFKKRIHFQKKDGPSSKNKIYFN